MTVPHAFNGAPPHTQLALGGQHNGGLGRNKDDAQIDRSNMSASEMQAGSSRAESDGAKFGGVIGLDSMEA